MKPVLAWVKANWIIVVLSVVILAVFPVAYVFSSGWNKKIRTAQETAGNNELRKVQAAKVEYVIPSYVPGTDAVTLSSAPNTVLTRWFKEHRERLASEAGSVVLRAVMFNRGEGPEAAALGRTPHTLLVEGMFPGGTDQTEKIRAFEDAILAEKGGTDPYADLLRGIGAGQPASPSRVYDVLADLRAREVERITENRRELTPEEAETVAKALQDRRFAEYRAVARQLGVYGGTEIFIPASYEANAQGRRTRGNSMELVRFTGRPAQRDIDALAQRAEDKPWKYFLWQWDLWVISDVLAAIEQVNAPAVRAGTGVEEGVVKRIVRMGLLVPEGMKEPQGDAFDPLGMGGMGGGGDPMGGAETGPTAEVPGMAPLDKNVSFTGRSMGSWNPVYDVRRVELDAVVSSARLNEFLAAIARTNFMTVTSMTIEPVDQWEDLRQGYYYGKEHVVLVQLEIESVWLRNWTQPLMPQSLKTRLGVPEPEMTEDASPS